MANKKNWLWKQFRLYMSLPHIWVLGIIILLAFISCIISVLSYNTNSFLSSIMSNVFAGLITGIVLNIISTVKAINLYKIDALTVWLEEIHIEIKKFFDMYNKMVYETETSFKSLDELYYYVYNTLCCGADIDDKILNDSHTKILPFNSYKYVKNTFDYDANKCKIKNQSLHDYIKDTNLENLSSNTLSEAFEDMNNRLRDLNKNILHHIKYLKIRRKALNHSVI